MREAPHVEHAGEGWPTVGEVRVLMADTDAMGIVYHASYLRWFELGRCELLRQGGLAYARMMELGLGLPVVEAHLRYRAPARYDDLLVVGARTGRLTRASVVFEYRISRAGGGGSQLVCEGSTLHACTGADGRVTRFPDEVFEPLRASASVGAPQLPRR